MAKEPHHKHFTRGGQIAFHNLRMFFQINKAVLNVHCVLWLMTCISLALYFIPLEWFVHLGSYYQAWLFKTMHKEHLFTLPYSGGVFKQTVHDLTTHPYYLKISMLCYQRLLWCAAVSLAISLIFGLNYRSEANAT